MTEIDFKQYPILFVDDEDLAVSSLKKYFEKEFTVFTATQGDEALDLIDRHPEIVLILTDQRMPKMTGIELLRKVMEKRPDIIRMLMTAFTDLKTLINAVNLGQVYQYVEKPYEPSQLKQYLKSGIERYFLIKERDGLYSEKVGTMQKMARMNRLEAIGILAAGMAHEINNPLVAIQTFLEMAPKKRTEADPDFWDTFHKVATKDVIRIRKIVSKLLTYAKNKKETRLFLVKTDLNKLIKETIVLLEKEAAKKKLLIKGEFISALPLISLDIEKMKQVIINLILNAIHAASEGFITIKTANLDENFVQFSISDTGIGISEENMEKLFNPFFTTKEAGTGLGLMTCHDIIDKHRGFINVKSVLSKGTTFIIQLPVDPEKHERRKNPR
ncbi:MAG: response regulator [Nitrospirae bacterium]|nr:response regulator [Nitrospirota bacterium]MBI3352913.1 response regulator [Nitrospirota bacterium]